MVSVVASWLGVARDDSGVFRWPRYSRTQASAPMSQYKERPRRIRASQSPTSSGERSYGTCVLAGFCLALTGAMSISAANVVQRGSHLGGTHTAIGSRHRVIDAQGRTRQVVVVSHQLRDDAGNVIGNEGYYVDLTSSTLLLKQEKRDREQWLTDKLARTLARRDPTRKNAVLSATVRPRSSPVSPTQVFALTL
jgi:hypothetical protein